MGLFYVDGFDTAYRSGTVDGSVGWLDALATATFKKQITQEQSEKITAYKKEHEIIARGDGWTNKMSWAGWTAMKITDAEIEQGMDRFYAIPANQAVCWQEAFVIVSHSIAGQSFYEADMSAIRGATAKGGCE